MNSLNIENKLDENTKLLILKMKKEIELKDNEIQLKDKEINDLKNELALLKSQTPNNNRRVFGRFSEQIDSSQEKKTKAQQIADKLYKQIKDENKYSLGEKLPTERDLVDEFNASRNSVREAIKILATEGIVTVKHGSGIYVDDVNLKNTSDFESLKEQSLELNSIYEFRIMYEPEIARLAAARATKEEIQEILKCAEEIVELVDCGEFYYKKDQEFHSLIAKASHNDIGIALAPLIMSFVVNGILISNANGGVQISSNNAREGHLAIAKFIEAHDQIGAYSAMRMHIEINQKFIREVNNF